MRAHTHTHTIAHKRTLTLSYSLCRYLLLPAKCFFFKVLKCIASFCRPLHPLTQSLLFCSLSLSPSLWVSLSVSLSYPLRSISPHSGCSHSPHQLSCSAIPFFPPALSFISLFTCMRGYRCTHTSASFSFLGTPPPISWERQEECGVSLSSLWIPSLD